MTAALNHKMAPMWPVVSYHGHVSTITSLWPSKHRLAGDRGAIGKGAVGDLKDESVSICYF